MPRAPTYNPATQGVAPIEARFRAPPGPSGGEMIAEAGRRLAQSVGQFAQVQDGINAEFDDTQARKLALQARTAAATVTSEFSSLQGGNAVSARVDTEGRLQKIREEALSSATNPRMRSLFEQYYDPGHAEALQQIGGHTIRQAQAERVGVLSSEVESYADLAINNPDKSEERLKAIDAGKASIAQLGQMKGMGEAEVALSQKKFVSGVHANTIDKLLATTDPDVEMVAAYYDAHADEMISADRERVMKDLQGPLQFRADYADFTRSFADAAPGEAPPAQNGSGWTKVATDVANKFGLTPTEVAAVMSYETGGTFSPTIMGGKGGQYMGLIQFGPAERKKYGIDKNSSPEQWSKAVTSYLEDRGFKKGMGVKDLYSTINAGAPGRYGASDGNGTVSSHVDNILREHMGTAEKWLAGGGVVPTETPRQWDKDAAYNRIDALADKEGWTLEKRERVKAVADKQIARDEQLLQRQYKAAGDEAVQAVIGLGDNFTDISQIPAATRAKMDPTDLMRLTETAAKNKAAKAAIPNDTTRSLELQALMRMDPEAFARIDLSKEVGRVSHDDLKDLFLKRADIIGDKNKPAKDKKRTIITAAIEWGKKYGGIDISDKDFPKVFDAMSAYLETVEAKKGVLDPSDGDAAFKGATRDIPKAGFFGGTMKAYNVTSVDQIPDVTRADIDRTFRAANRRDPNDMERLKMYRSMLVNAGAR